MKRNWTASALFGVTCVVLAACAGDDDDDSDFPTPSPTASPTPTVSPTPTPPAFNFRNSEGFRTGAGTEFWLRTESGFEGEVAAVRVIGDPGAATYYNVVKTFEGGEPVAPGSQLWLVDDSGSPPTPGTNNYRYDIDYVYGVSTTGGGWYTETASSTATAPAAIVTDLVPAGDLVISAVTASCGSPNFLRFVLEVDSDVSVEEVRVYANAASNPAHVVGDGVGGPLICPQALEAVLYTGTPLIFDACEFIGPATLASGTYRAIFRGRDLVEGDDYFQFVQFTYSDVTQGSCYETP